MDNFKRIASFLNTAFKPRPGQKFQGWKVKKWTPIKKDRNKQEYGGYLKLTNPQSWDAIEIAHDKGIWYALSSKSRRTVEGKDLLQTINEAIKVFK